jgi:post-segregation antitoxin (ccd killing protein)
MPFGQHRRRAGRRYPDNVATTEKTSVEIDDELLERARQVARERGVELSQLVHDALEHEIGASAPRPGRDEGEQAPLTFIGAFHSRRGNLSKLASEDVFEPEPFR